MEFFNNNNKDDDDDDENNNKYGICIAHTHAGKEFFLRFLCYIIDQTDSLPALVLFLTVDPKVSVQFILYYISNSSLCMPREGEINWCGLRDNADNRYLFSR